MPDLRRTEGRQKRGEIGQCAQSAPVQDDPPEGMQGSRGQFVGAEGTRRDKERNLVVVQVYSRGKGVCACRGRVERLELACHKETYCRQFPVAVSTQNQNGVCVDGGGVFAMAGTIVTARPDPSQLARKEGPAP